MPGNPLVSIDSIERILSAIEDFNYRNTPMRKVRIEFWPFPVMCDKASTVPVISMTDIDGNTVRTVVTAPGTVYHIRETLMDMLDDLKLAEAKSRDDPSLVAHTDWVFGVVGAVSSYNNAHKDDGLRAYLSIAPPCYEERDYTARLELEDDRTHEKCVIHINFDEPHAKTRTRLEELEHQFRPDIPEEDEDGKR